MEWLNYHHLLYFWTVARLGSIARASEELLLAPPTISAQIKSLEETLGEQLFRREGRRLVLTDMGQTVFRYADEIFGLGNELLSVIKQRPTEGPLRLAVGITDSVAKLAVREILKPALQMERPVQLLCREGRVEGLLAELASFRLDLVLSHQPGDASEKTFSHLLGCFGMSFLAAPSLAERLEGPFPACLDGAPALLPTPDTALRRSLDGWFQRHGLRPRVVAEFEDTALMTAFAGDALGFLVVPSIIVAEVQRRFGPTLLGEADGCEERLYAITARSKRVHPAVTVVMDAARERMSR